MILNCIAFLIQASGDLSNRSIYEEGYINLVRHYLLSTLYIQSPYLYTLIGILLFGVVSGILSVFTTAISMFNIKFKVFLFLPVYALLYLIGMIPQIVSKLEWTTRYFSYLWLFEETPKSLVAFFSFLFILVLGSVIIVYYRVKEETWL